VGEKFDSGNKGRNGDRVSCVSGGPSQVNVGEESQHHSLFMDCEGGGRGGGGGGH
jgi:hypothetical protein